jgi:hypothetical protein
LKEIQIFALLQPSQALSPDESLRLDLRAERPLSLVRASVTTRSQDQ